jgi:hypothetical protein
MSECFDRHWPRWPTLFVRICPQPWFRTSIEANQRATRSKLAVSA